MHERVPDGSASSSASSVRGIVEITEVKPDLFYAALEIGDAIRSSVSNDAHRGGIWSKVAKSNVSAPRLPNNRSLVISPFHSEGNRTSLPWPPVNGSLAPSPGRVGGVVAKVAVDDVVSRVSIQKCRCPVLHIPVSLPQGPLGADRCQDCRRSGRRRHFHTRKIVILSAVDGVVTSTTFYEGSLPKLP